MKQFLTSAQVASRTGLDQSTVLKWARRGAFPGAHKALGKWWFTVAGVRAFNARRKQARAR